jgi:hypothetical protein
VETCEQLKVMLVLTKEVRAFQSFTCFQQAAGLATSLCRQNEGWLLSRKQGLNHQPHPDGGRYVKRILAAGKDLAVMEENGPGEFAAERYVNELFLERACHA